MPDITITDGVALSVDLKLQDQVPLAKANLKTFLAAGKEIFESFNEPIDKADVQAMALGGTFTSPNLLSDDLTTLTIGPGVNCGFSVVKPANKNLFADDGFSPPIPIAANEAWMGFDVDLSFSATTGATVNGIGVCVAGASKVQACTWTLFITSVPPLPTLLVGLETVLDRFSITTSAAAIRSQLPKTVNTMNVTGSITASVSVQQPFTLNPLASANLPFNETASIQPNVRSNSELRCRLQATS